jgi:hypothetical protein
MMKNDTSEPEDCAFAALETGARLRGLASASASGQLADEVERTIAAIEAESAGIQTDGSSAVEAVAARQAFALDTLFVQLAADAARAGGLCAEPMRLALKAQAQSRINFTSLIFLFRSRSAARRPRRRAKNAREQTVENGNNHT